MGTALEWTILTLEVPADTADDLADWLREELNLSPVLLERPGSDVTWVELYFKSGHDVKSVLDSIASHYPVRASRLRALGDRDWQTFWRHHFKPHAVGHRLWITPEWDRAATSPGHRIPLILDPGLSFGTGDHFTTRFCLEQLEQRLQEGNEVWDVGCGSGVLGIAAVLLGARSAFGTDSDPHCLMHAEANARLNGVQAKTSWAREDILQPSQTATCYDWVVANLYALLLLEAAPRLWDATRCGVMISGIREFEVDAVAERFLALGAHEISRDGDGEWAGIVLLKNNPR